MATPRKKKTKKATVAKRPASESRKKTAKAKPKAPKKSEAAAARKTAKKKVSTAKPAKTTKPKAAKKVAKAPREKKEKPKAAPVPKKSPLDPAFLQAVKAALEAQCDRLRSVVRSTRAQMAEKTTGLPDVSDQASEGYGDELAVGLIAIEAAQLDEIEAAIGRIEQGRYGLCIDCQKLIPKKRLEVLPFARRCLACEGAREHRRRTQGSYAGDDD